MLSLNSPVESLGGIGSRRAALLSKLGIRCAKDFLTYYPRAYENRTVFKKIAELSEGDSVCINALVGTEPTFTHIRQGMDILRFHVADETGTLMLTFFNQSYLKNFFHVGDSYIFYGTARKNQKHLELTNPVFEKEGSTGVVTGCILPIYSLTAGISQNIIIKAVRELLNAEIFPDALPEKIRTGFGLAQARFSYENIHFPQNEASLELARRRLVFEELFTLSCAMGSLKRRQIQKSSVKITALPAEDFTALLPYSLTNAQLRTINECFSDICSGVPMNRLVQGDVGSGKTVVAAACIWLVCKNSYQCAFMAPTEILAQQHYENLSRMLSPLGIRCVLLTGRLTAKEKRLVHEAIASGEADLVIGTHAIISESVKFNKLALVITDEQHRFGVNQRAALSEKGENPHTLVMSATPIPRTLALIIYGDLDVSLIDERPPGRQSIATYAVDEAMRPRILNFIRKLVSAGRQVYIICPLVEDNPELNLKSAESYAENIKKLFPDLRTDFLHGKMKADRKEAVMADFAAGNTDILVATTVIEVGIDVPNAALIIVENSERFGLSQLHQLRGRVGRGQYQSYCVLFSEKSDIPRLNVMCRTTDGFKIAEEDLRLRGPGDFFGSRQHGLPDLKIADLSTDMTVLKDAQSAAAQLLQEDPFLSAKENAALLKATQDMLSLSSKI